MTMTTSHLVWDLLISAAFIAQGLGWARSLRQWNRSLAGQEAYVHASGALVARMARQHADTNEALTKLRNAAADVLYHDERGQGVGYAEAMKNLHKLANERGD